MILQEAAASRVLSEMPSLLDQYAVPVNKVAYPSWSTYIQSFLAEGVFLSVYSFYQLINSIKVLSRQRTGLLRLKDNEKPVEGAAGGCLG